MSRTFTKLFSSITESTIWCEPNHVRIVWICMLAMADARGRVWASVPGLANRARVELHEAEQAIELFLSPDKYSRTPDHEGRRIEPIDGGWRLLNHEKYRAIRDEESAKEAKRKYINARRQEEKSKAAGVDNVEQCRSTVDRCRDNADADADADKSKSKSKPPAAPAAELPDWIPADAWKGFCEMRRKERHPLTDRAASLIVAELDKLRGQGHDPAQVLDQSTAAGWRGVFPIKADAGRATQFPQRSSREAPMLPRLDLGAAR